MSRGEIYPSLCKFDIPDPVQVLLNIAFGSEGKVAGIVEHLRELGARKKGQIRRSEPKRVVEH